MVSSAGTNAAEFQANWTSPPQPGSGMYSSDQRGGSTSDGSPMSVSNQHRHSTGSDMSQQQHQDSPAQPQSQQFGQPSGTPQTPVGYPPSNDFPPPRTPHAQQGSSPSKQVPMGMGMMGTGLHRYVLLAYSQTALISPQYTGYDDFNVEHFTKNNNLQQPPIAGNFFRAHGTPF